MNYLQVLGGGQAYFGRCPKFSCFLIMRPPLSLVVVVVVVVVVVFVVIFIIVGNKTLTLKIGKNWVNNK